MRAARVMLGGGLERIRERASAVPTRPVPPRIRISDKEHRSNGLVRTGLGWGSGGMGRNAWNG